MSYIKEAIKRRIPDSIYLRWRFKKIMGYRLDLRNPKTFSEKLQWLKLYDRRSQYTNMVDKYEVKQYVASRIGRDYIIPSYGVWNKFDEIDFDKLPNKFVLKTTHDSGGVAIIKDKRSIDLEKVRNKIDSSLHRNFYYCGREWPYKNVKPRIIAEEYLEDPLNPTVLNDYKVLCFNGIPKLIEIHQGRHTTQYTQNFYTPDWKPTTFSQIGDPVSDEFIPKPKRLEQMLEFSEALSKDIAHLRVDWYSIGDSLYFGELTFYDGSGMVPFTSYEQDLEIGSWLTLPNKKFSK